jgi:hypothetical protein
MKNIIIFSLFATITLIMCCAPKTENNNSVSFSSEKEDSLSLISALNKEGWYKLFFNVDYVKSIHKTTTLDAEKEVYYMIYDDADANFFYECMTVFDEETFNKLNESVYGEKEYRFYLLHKGSTYILIDNLEKLF